jgi:hypothetical protein
LAGVTLELDGDLILASESSRKALMPTIFVADHISDFHQELSFVDLVRQLSDDNS